MLPHRPQTPAPAPDASAPSDDPVAIYDWSDPEAHASPSSDHHRADSDHLRDHAFWERLPYRGIPWTRVLFVGVICFGLWFLLDAPSLQRSAQVSPIGARRTVSLDVTGPVAALSRGLGLSNVVGWTDRAFGRTPGGGPSLNVSIRRPKSKPLPVESGTTTVTTLPPLNFHPTPADPLRVLIVGDSVGLDLGQPLVSALGAYGDVSTYLDGRVDTGLSRPDYFNWPAELSVDLANQEPQLVVVMIGANDPQTLLTPEGNIAYGQPGWSSAYSMRVTSFIDEANAAGAHVLWVGMPPMQNPGLGAELAHLNSLVHAAVTSSGDGNTYLSSAHALGGPGGTFAAYLPNASGAEINVRTPDGIHLTPGGGAVLAAAVVNSIQDDLHVQLAQGIGGTARRS